MALLVDESIETYMQVLQTFIKVMHNKHPRLLTTDSDKVMKKAVQNVCPNAAHRLCM